jgi:hypothetical protein
MVCDCLISVTHHDVTLISSSNSQHLQAVCGRHFDQIMPFVHITWLPKTCRNAATRKEVADAVIKVRESKGALVHTS